MSDLRDDRKLSDEARSLIREYLELMQEHADRGYRACREGSRAMPYPWMRRQVDYWRNARSAFRWAVKQLRHY